MQGRNHRAEAASGEAHVASWLKLTNRSSDVESPASWDKFIFAADAGQYYNTILDEHTYVMNNGGAALADKPRSEIPVPGWVGIGTRPNAVRHLDVTVV